MATSNPSILILGNILQKVRTQAILKGAEKLGLRPVTLLQPTIPLLQRTISEYNIVCAVSVGMRASDAFAKGFLLSQGIGTLILDLGYIKRATGPKDYTGYNQLGWNRLCWVPKEDRSSDRLTQLGIDQTTLQPIEERPGNVLLVLGQVPGDTQHGMAPGDLKAWLLAKAGQYKGLGYRIEYRPHPKASKFLAHCEGKFFDKVHKPLIGSLEQNFKQASKVLTFNSTAGLQALMSGLPVESHPSAHYHGITDSEELYGYLCRLAYAQWTCAELETGEPLKFMAWYNEKLYKHVIDPRHGEDSFVRAS